VRCKDVLCCKNTDHSEKEKAVASLLFEAAAAVSVHSITIAVLLHTATVVAAAPAFAYGCTWFCYLYSRKHSEARHAKATESLDAGDENDSDVAVMPWGHPTPVTAETLEEGQRQEKALR